jgi:hypothetical protein
VALNSTYAVRLGSIAAAITWIGLILAPGSRAEETAQPSAGDAIAAAATAPIPSTAPATTAPPAPSTVPATTAVVPATTTVLPAPTTPAKTAGPTTTAAPVLRVLSVRELVGVSIDRVSSWIAIATVTVVDQTGAPAAAVEVKASWSLGSTAVSCTTDNSGKCSMYQSAIPTDVGAVTIALTTPSIATKSISRQSVN